MLLRSSENAHSDDGERLAVIFDVFTEVHWA
jgi:hypothetical protein